MKKLAQSKKVICHKEIKYVETRSTATINYAKKIKAGLIVIMTDQSSEFINRITLGTYAHQLINGASVPVLSIPPENHPENVEMSAPGGLW